MSDAEKGDAPRWRPAPGAPPDADGDTVAGQPGAAPVPSSAAPGAVQLGSLLKTGAASAPTPPALEPPAGELAETAPSAEPLAATGDADEPPPPHTPGEAPPLWSPAPSGAGEPRTSPEVGAPSQDWRPVSPVDQPPAGAAESPPTLWSPAAAERASPSETIRAESVTAPSHLDQTPSATTSPGVTAWSDTPAEPRRSAEPSAGMQRETRVHIADDDFSAREPVRATPLAGVDPRSAPRSSDRRGLLVGGAVAVVALTAIAGVLLLGRDRDEAPDGSRAEAGPAEVQRPVAGAFQPPDREAVRDAYAEVGRIFRTAGVSGLAEAGRSCFAGLNERPTYRGLDYCTALDAFGAAFAHRAAGAPAPADSWFGQVEDRFLSTAGAIMGPERDAAARLVDIRRLAIEVARESGPAFAAGGARPDPQTASVGSAGSVQVETVEPTPAPPPGAPSAPTQPRRADTAPPTQRAQAPAPVAVPRRPAAGEVDREAYAAARDPGPTASEVAAARPRAGRGPSFNCRYARSASERMVCSEPDLAALDRRLNAAYEDAIAAGASRRALRLEQDAWLARREAAAPDPDAVADSYRRRIEELESGG